MNRWLRLFPKPWRDRYGDELTELLAASPRCRVDLATTAAAMWADHLGNQMRRRRGVMSMVRATALALVALGVVSVAWATSELQDGLAGLLGHWWSALATAPLLAGLVLAVPAWRARAPRPG